VRVDSAIYDGYRVPQYYDSMIAKLIVHGNTRNECLMRLHRCLEEFVVEGIFTNIPLHEKIIIEPDFIDGNFNIHWLQNWLKNREEADKV
jgi:acetyl-CoA carboxylase biotin carboxylase subunit